MCECENCGSEMEDIPADPVFDTPEYFYCKICGNAEWKVIQEATTV